MRTAPPVLRIAPFLAALHTAALASLPCTAAQPFPTAARHVIVISLDGLRGDAIAAADAPTLARMIRDGVATLECENELPPATLPNHASMLTGLTVAQHGVIINWDAAGQISKPTIIDMATKAGLSAAFFASKTKFSYLCKPQAAAVREIEPDLDKMTQRVQKTLKTLQPALIFIHFNEPDGTGHHIGWMTPEYLAAIHRVDSLLASLLETLERTKLMESTCIILTSDHGGQGKTHMFNTPLERHVPMILFGAGGRNGQTFGQQMHVRDVAPLTCYLLGLKMPRAWRTRIPEVAFQTASTSPETLATAPLLTRSATPWLAIILSSTGGLLIWLSHRRQ